MGKLLTLKQFRLIRDEIALKNMTMRLKLLEQHPDCVTITYRWGRWQHLVDYSRFKHNKLVLKPGIKLQDKTDEYGLKFVSSQPAE